MTATATPIAQGDYVQYRGPNCATSQYVFYGDYGVVKAIIDSDVYIQLEYPIRVAIMLPEEHVHLFHRLILHPGWRPMSTVQDSWLLRLETAAYEVRPCSDGWTWLCMSGGRLVRHGRHATGGREFCCLMAQADARSHGLLPKGEFA